MKNKLLLAVIAFLMFSGYTLPPEPNKKENKKTLLGIDLNNNGIRDDVEIYIVKRFQDENMRNIAFDIAKSLQNILLVTDKESVLKAKKEFDRARGCRKYYASEAIKIEKSDTNAASFRMKYKIYDAGFRDKQFNTPQRMHTYFDYHRNLPDKAYEIIDISEEECDEFLQN